MWTASEKSDLNRAKDRELFDSIEQLEAEPADYQTIDSVASEPGQKPAVGGRYTRANQLKYSQSASGDPRRQRHRVAGLPLSLWFTGFIVLGTLGAFWVSGNEELSDKNGLSFLRGDKNTVATSAETGASVENDS